jgi:hypothetical protein
MAEEGNRAVFWELGLAEKEKDPTDPTGKRFQAILGVRLRLRILHYIRYKTNFFVELQI